MYSPTYTRGVCPGSGQVIAIGSSIMDLAHKFMELSSDTVDL